MGKRKTISISLTRLIQIQMVLTEVFGKPLTEIVRLMLDGNISDNVIGLAMDTLNRLEADGYNIVVSVGIKIFISEFIRRAVGRKQVLKIGMLRVTL